MIKFLEKLGLKQKNKFGKWENVTVFSNSGGYVLIQTRKCELTNLVQFNRVSMGWVNSYETMPDIRKKLGLD